MTPTVPTVETARNRIRVRQAALPLGARFDRVVAAISLTQADGERVSSAYAGDQRMFLGATTFGMFVEMPLMDDPRDPWLERMLQCPATVVSSTLKGPVDRPDATIVDEDPREVVRGMKEESDVAIRSHGSLSVNRALMAAGLVDRVQITIFPVVSAQSGDEPIFRGARDFDLELLESRRFDGRTQELVYRPTLRTWP